MIQFINYVVNYERSVINMSNKKHFNFSTKLAMFGKIHSFDNLESQ